jgi:hypothetical protein
LGEWIDHHYTRHGADFGALVKSSLGLQLRNTNPLAGTGDQLEFEMTFAPGKVNADSLLVDLVLEKPKIGVGNLFAEHKLTSKQMRDVFAQESMPDGSPAYFKKLYLNQEGKAPFPQRDSLKVVFNDLGIDGDRVAHDGIYSWRTEPLRFPDIYKFNFDIRGRTENDESSVERR